MQSSTEMELPDYMPVVKRGNLTVKDGKGEWTVRWCVVQGTRFATYVQRGDEKAQKVLDLVGATIVAFAEPRRPFGFFITIKSGRKYQLSAETKLDQEDWISRMTDLATNGIRSALLVSSRGAATRTKTISTPGIKSRAEVTPKTTAPDSDPVKRKKSLRGFKSPRSKSPVREAPEKKEVVAPIPVEEDEAARVRALYEKNKGRLLKGGIDKSEFERNSGVIMRVLSLETTMESNSRRYSRNAQAAAEEDDEESDDSSAERKPLPPSPMDKSTSAPLPKAASRSSAPGPAPAPSPARGDHRKRSEHFVPSRGSMQLERNQFSLREMCNKADPMKKFKKMVKIGEGSFGMVYMAQNVETKQKVAVKKMAITKKNRVHLETELALHKASSNHPNVVRLLESYVVQDAKRYEVWAVLEFLENGALTETLTVLDMKEPDIAYVCKEVMAALSWLHSRNLIHRDVKSDNILLGSSGEVKLGDFGLAIELVKGAEKRRSVLGTPFWMSPEVINGKDYDDRVDVWSLGVTTIEMMLKTPPYASYPKTKALFLITSQGIPLSTLGAKGAWSAACRDWLAKCLTYDAAARPNVWTLADHEFMAQADTREAFIRRIIAPMRGKVKQCAIM